MENLYGTIDLTKLGNIVRQHPELVREVTFKNGEIHKVINVNINQKQQEDQYGNVAYVKVGVKKDDEKQGLNYFLGDLKVSKFGTEQKPQQQAQYYAPSPNSENDLPF